MEKLPILCGGERVGEAEAEPDSLYTCLRVRIPSRRGMWRAWAVGERGEIRIGTLEPVGVESVISRRFSRQSLSKVGALTRVEVRPADADTSPERIAGKAWPDENPGRIAGKAERPDASPGSVAEKAGRPDASPGNVVARAGWPDENPECIAESAARPDGNPSDAAGRTEAVESPETWERTGARPLFRNARFRRQSRHVRDALTRTDGNRRRVAIAKDENAPFPLPELFCLASAAKIGARDYWVFAFDSREWPVL